MTADALLSRLEGVKKTGDRKWQARCPAHDDRSPSLSIREELDGRVLLHDFAGCSVEEVLAGIGLNFDVLYPPRPLQSHGFAPLRRPWIPSDAFDIAVHEILVVALIGCDLHKRKVIAANDYQRLFVAVERLNNIAGAVYAK